MTMHLAHPALTMGGKRKGKVKFRNADEARKARELAQEWERKQAEWKAMSKPVKPISKKSMPTVTTPHIRQTDKIPSLNAWITGAVTTKQTQHYTGDKVMGVTIVHKSCLQPVFNQQEAIDAASMRR
jgi:hypothetical protein